MEYVSPHYQETLGHLAETLMAAKRARLLADAESMLPEDQQVEASIERTRQACIADEEQRLGQLVLMPMAEVIPLPQPPTAA